MMLFAYLQVVKGLTDWIQPTEEQVKGFGELFRWRYVWGQKVFPTVSHINDLQSVYHKGDTGHYKFGISYPISIIRYIDTYTREQEQSPWWHGWNICVDQQHRLALTMAGTAVYAAGQKQRIISLRKSSHLTWKQVSFPLRLHVHGKDSNSSLLKFHVINMDCCSYQQYYPSAYSNIVIGFWIVKFRTHRPTF